MQHEFEYATESERQSILATNADKYLIAKRNLVSGNSLIFTDEKPMSVQIKELEAKTDRAVMELTMVIAMGGMA